MREAPAPQEAIPRWTTGDRLRKARLEAGLDQDALARVSGIARSSVINYESNRPIPAWPILLAWSKVTGIPLEWLCHGDLTPCGPRPRRRPHPRDSTGSNYMQCLTVLSAA